MTSHAKPTEGFKILQPVHYHELLVRKDLMVLLEESMRVDPLSITLEQLMDGIETRECILWTWGKGILITEVKDLPQGRVLFITNVRGEGFLQNLHLIDEDILSYARAIGVDYMVGEVWHPGLVKAYVKRGAKVMHRVLREVK